MAARLLIFAVFVHASFAFSLFQTQVAEANGREVEESCLQAADDGDCSFYTCFDERLPCGWRHYMRRRGHYYCNKMQTRKDNFSPAGQQFIEDALKCMMVPLKEVYTVDTIDCDDLEDLAVDAIAPCFNESNFCDVLQADSEQFFSVFEITDLVTRGATKMWRAIFQITRQCGIHFARQIASDTSNSVLGSINGFFNSLMNPSAA